MRHAGVSAFALAGIVIAEAKLNNKTHASNVADTLIRPPDRTRKAPRGTALRGFQPSLPDSVDKPCISREAAAGGIQHT